MLHNFAGPPFGGAGADGVNPTSRLTIDSSGNLYSTTQGGGADGLGTVFELVNSSGPYTEKILYSFTGFNGDGAIPYAVALVRDSAGNLYGTTTYGGADSSTLCTSLGGCGTVFVNSATSPGTYTENVLYSFTDANGDTGFPQTGLAVDQAGNLFGTSRAVSDEHADLRHSAGGSLRPWLFEGPMNGEMFLAWVEQGLAPRLEAGDLVIMDNLATHKIRGVREALEAAGARLLYLPPYSPDFNPIEPMWSKIKQILRSHAPRTNDQLLGAARTAFQSISVRTARASFLAPDTLHNTWNCFSGSGLLLPVQLCLFRRKSPPPRNA